MLRLGVLLITLFLLGCSEPLLPIELFSDARVLHGAWQLRLNQVCPPSNKELFWRPDGGEVIVSQRIFGVDSTTESLFILDPKSGQPRVIRSGFIGNVFWKADGSAFAVLVGERSTWKLEFYQAVSLELLGEVVVDDPDLLLSADFRFVVSRNFNSGFWEVLHLEDFVLSFGFELPDFYSWISQISADGKTALVVSRDDNQFRFRWLELASARMSEIRVLPVDTNLIRRVIPDPKLEFFLISDNTGNLQVWNPKTGSLTPFGVPNMFEPQWSLDGLSVAVMRYDLGSLQVLAFPSGLLKWEAKNVNRGFNSFWLRPDGLALVSLESNLAQDTGCGLTIFEKTISGVSSKNLITQVLEQEVFDLQLLAKPDVTAHTYLFSGQAIRQSDQLEFMVSGFGQGEPDGLFKASQTAPLEVRLDLIRGSKRLVFYLKQDGVIYRPRGLVTLDLGNGLQNYVLRLERR
jgi:hypothetical protein